jgi:hypothetical protein
LDKLSHPYFPRGFPAFNACLVELFTLAVIIRPVSYPFFVGEIGPSGGLVSDRVVTRPHNDSGRDHALGEYELDSIKKRGECSTELFCKAKP